MKGLGWRKKRIRKAYGLEWVFVPAFEVGTRSEQVGTSNNSGLVPSVPTESPQHFKEEKNNINTRTHDFMCIGEEKSVSVGTVGTSSTDGLFRPVPSPFRPQGSEQIEKPTIILTPEDLDE